MRQLRQRFLTHQVRTHARQIAFAHALAALVKQIGHRQIQHRIAQKLEAFVVLGPAAAVA